MGRVLKFTPRHQQISDKPVTQEQILEQLRKRTLDNVRELVSYYNSTGVWKSEVCDPHMVRAIDELYAVCAILAGAKYGQSTPSIG